MTYVAKVATFPFRKITVKHTDDHFPTSPIAISAVIVKNQDILFVIVSNICVHFKCLNYFGEKYSLRLNDKQLHKISNRFLITNHYHATFNIFLKYLYL